MTKLQSVYFIKEMITLCTGCFSRLKVYKLEATYRNIENSKITANLMTDVLFCERCARGYLLEAFRITIDQHGKRWIALETAAPVKEGLKVNSPSTVNGSGKIPNNGT